MLRVATRDRTGEFTAVAERIRKTIAVTSGGATDGGATASTSAVRERSENGNASDFAKMASAIGHGIHRTSLKLERLNALAKSSTLYDDKSREIAETSAVIKLDIQALNESIVELQNVAARSRRDGTGSKSAADHSGTVVDTLKNRLATATKSFKETLTTRQREVKAGEERRAALGVSTPQALDAGVDYLGDDPFAKAMLASGATPSNAFGNLQGMNRANDFVPRPIAPGAGAPPPPGGFAQTQGQMQLYNQNNAYADSRQEALQNVERTITDDVRTFALDVRAFHV